MKIPVVAILPQSRLHFVQDLVQQLYLLVLLPGHQIKCQLSFYLFGIIVEFKMRILMPNSEQHYVSA